MRLIHLPDPVPPANRAIFRVAFDSTEGILSAQSILQAHQCEISHEFHRLAIASGDLQTAILKYAGWGDPVGSCDGRFAATHDRNADGVIELCVQVLGSDEPSHRFGLSDETTNFRWATFGPDGRLYVALTIPPEFAPEQVVYPTVWRLDPDKDKPFKQIAGWNLVIPMPV